ncbi:MAG: hypothetical protein ACRDZ9_06085 [Acidimicrobiales bacterium]
MSVRRLGQLLTVVVLVTSATYVLVYLYRWEWNRALVAGVFFLAAEVAVVAGTVLRRLRAIEARLDGLAHRSPLPPDPEPPPLHRIQESAPGPSRPFAWLDPTRTHVFVPVLLGAGAMLSVLAHGVERLAGATAVPALERRLARRLAPLALPGVGLVPAGAVGETHTPVAAVPASTPSGGLAGLALRVVAVVVAVAGVTTGVDTLADATQNRPDAPAAGLATELTLAVSHRQGGGATLQTAEGLWVACRPTLGRRASARELTELGGGRVSLLIEPALGEHARRRFQGCLEDATFDRVRAEVVGLATVPAARAPAGAPAG